MTEDKDILIDLQKHFDMLEEVLPKYCPNCGEKLERISKNNKIWIMPTGSPLHDGSLKIEDFDCYCNGCEWSGYIGPDALLELDPIPKREGDQ